MSENTAILGFFDYAIGEEPFVGAEGSGVIKSGLPGSSIYVPVYDTNNCVSCIKNVIGCGDLADVRSRRECERRINIQPQKYLSLDPFMAQRTRIRTGLSEESNHDVLRTCYPLCGNENSFIAG